MSHSTEPVMRKQRKIRLKCMSSFPFDIHKPYARKQRKYVVSEFFVFRKIALGTYLGLMLSSCTVACLDADDLRTVDVTFITIVRRDSRLRVFGRCRLGFVKAQSICNSVAGLDLVFPEHMRIQVQSSQRAKRTHNLLLLKTAHLRCFIIFLNIKPHLVRQRLVKQLVVNVNIPRPVCRIFVYRDVLDQFKSHFTSQLGNVSIFL